MLAAERQGDLIGIQTALWLDGSDDHWSYGGSFGDLGKLVLKRDGQQIATSAYPYDVFSVPDEDSAYELTQYLEKIPSSDRNWLRSTAVATTWGFRSHREPDVYSRGLPILFPVYDVPVDGMNTLAGAERHQGRPVGRGPRRVHPGRDHGGLAVLLLRRRHHLDHGVDPEEGRQVDGRPRPHRRHRQAGHDEGRVHRRQRQRGHPDHHPRLRRSLTTRCPAGQPFSS